MFAFASRRRCVAALSFLAVCCLQAAGANAATRIELKIDELRANRTVPWPVTTGVPFPQDGLTDASQCRLVDDRGEEVLLQSRIAATWEVDRKSIRWLTIDFIAQPGRKYHLEYGPTVMRQAPKPLRPVGKIPDLIAIDTGILSIDFSPRGPSALKSLRVDLNNDGKIADDELIAAGPTDGDHVYLTPDGGRASNAGDVEQRQIVVEVNGPVRSCVRVDGFYTGPNGQRIVKYRTRYHAWEGLSLLKVVDEFRVVGSTRDTQFADIALPIDLKLDKASRQVVTAQSAESPTALVKTAWSDSTKAFSLTQETFRHYGNQECRGYLVEKQADKERIANATEKAASWLQVSDHRAAVTGSLRWFWQQFPKEWEVADDRLTLHLWSPRAAALDFGEAGIRKFFGPAGHQYLLNWEGVRKPQTPIENFFYFAGRHAMERDGADGLGTNKHHEVWYHFAPAAKAADGQQYGDLAERQPLCLATGEWNCSTGVFGTLAARPNNSPYEAIVDRIFELERYAQDSFGDYGWWLFGAGPHYSYQWDAKTQRHYADPRRFEYHTYQRETQLWWCYLRSGERKFYDWAIPSENHWVDIAVTHAPTKFSTEWRGGAKGDATLHYPVGDWSIDSPLHYVRHHDTGEAWLRSASQYWGSYHRTLETTTLAYFLTGDERYNDVVNFWRDYWGALAGVRSDSTEVKPWHREQMWFQPTKPGEPTKSWAEMLRDYAPFQSGSRHQMTLFFNLSTLYEHTWDPVIKQVLDEYAAAFLDSESPNGVWQCQDHRLPANANSPMLAHYWSSALWKYARASNDPRMPAILKKYFTACYEADPYNGDVGIYSNVQMAWAWHFTRDPRHLIAARHELDLLLPNAEPLSKPEDLGGRIYNPYEPIRALAAVPRLIGVLKDAERAGVKLPPMPPLSPQRTLIAIERQAGKPFEGVLWGWDEMPTILDSSGKPIAYQGSMKVHRSHRQPFDRELSGYRVIRTELSLPSSNDRWAFVDAKVETGILEQSGGDHVACWAGEPIRIEPRSRWSWRRVAGVDQLQLETARPTLLKVSHGGKILTSSVVKNTLVVPLANVPTNAVVTIEDSSSNGSWFRLVGEDNGAKWVFPGSKVPETLPPSSIPSARTRTTVDPAQTFVSGRHGQAMLVVPGRELQIPDEITLADGTTERLSNQQEGTIEFWVRRMWDERMSPVSPLTFLTCGSIQAWCPWKLPLDEWAHVAVVWRQVADLPDRSLVHIYVNGRDYGNYRSLYWAGYAPPPTFGNNREWLKKFVVRSAPGAMFAIDDIRISNKPRYVDLKLNFGRDQTFNPLTFDPPSKPAERDDATVMLLPLDGNTRGIAIGNKPIEATIVMEKSPAK